MARRSDHSREELKDLILKVSWDIVGKDGFEGLTARRVATDIGYTPGTIYNVFSSMDDLYLAINARTLDNLYDVLNGPKCNNPSKSPVQNMKVMADLYTRFARDNRLYWLMLFNHRLPDGRYAEEWYQEKIDRLFIPLENLLRPFFSDRKSQKRKMATRLLWASVHGLCFLQETGKISIVGDGRTTPDLASYLIDTFVAGIGKENKKDPLS